MLFDLSPGTWVAILGLILTVIAVPSYKFVVGLKLENAALTGRIEVLERDMSDLKTREAKRDENIAHMASGIGDMRETLARIETAITFLTKGGNGGS